MRELLFGFCLCMLMISAVGAEEGTRMLHQPDISADRIVFVYAGDLWTASANGGDARRLTAHIGTESSPKFSPDGRWIAFSGQYDGNTDVFIIPSEGDRPKRLTFHPGGDTPIDFTQTVKRNYSPLVLMADTLNSFQYPGPTWHRILRTGPPWPIRPWAMRSEHGNAIGGGELHPPGLST